MKLIFDMGNAIAHDKDNGRVSALSLEHRQKMRGLCKKKYFFLSIFERNS